VWDEESGELHRELKGFGSWAVTALATFLSPDGQQPRLVAGSYRRHVGCMTRRRALCCTASTATRT
jgi:hypothetical protein